MASRKEVLAEAQLGSRVAEDEGESLHSYFVETDQWRRLLTGDVDIVFGAKGTGKSALYSLLLAKKEELRLGRRTLFLAAENPRGTPAFRDLGTGPALTEDQLRGLWKLYFLSLSANYLRHHMETAKIRNDKATHVIGVLTENKLLEPNVNLLARLKATMEYLRRYIPNLDLKMTDPSTGYEFSGKITLAEPNGEQRQQGYVSADNLLETLDAAFAEMHITIWLVLDRLDVAFAESDELEVTALRALFRTYLDIVGLSQIKVKIFLRDDIWRKIVIGGFREASHVTRTLTLSWNQQSLLNLLVRRLSFNESLCKYYGLRRGDIIATAQLQNDFFYSIFPQKIDIGAKQPNTLDWMLSRTADGTKRTAPRELIHLLLETRAEQLKLYELGNAEPDENRLFSNSAVRFALPAVSRARYELTLCAENPSLKPYLEKLEREKAQQSVATLESLWKCTTQKATEIAEKLVEAGFFERRGTKDAPAYWAPFLYRDALHLVQGAA
ncbi:MAG TPA: hypothetical protein VME63_03050 [Dyella sp.]|uniref:P-loop ATPase, Sll1717 family n=1 Tax=Dyella sp. TaxID=1869338 RepID=UPI002BB21939|nr:hypothetical protein [Dyella sp.]HTV84354.1 hypothetical protein [Dyella sp.]